MKPMERTVTTVTPQAKCPQVRIAASESASATSGHGALLHRGNASILAVLCVAALFAGALPAAEANPPKYVAFAWEFGGSSPQDMLKVVDQFDRTPLDGVGLKLRADAVIDGVRTNLNYRRFMQAPAWPKEAFASQIPHFRKLTAHKSMRHSFLTSFHCPRTRIAWTDDAAWAVVAKSMRTVAWVAKQGGLKGISADPEDYRKVQQFIRRPGEPPYDELCEIVRRRGRELFKPVFEEYPDVTLHFFWFMSNVRFYVRRDGTDPERMVRLDESLWPAFLNGVLDVLPPGASINDGDEEGYWHSAAKNGYRNGAYLFHHVYPKLVAPENLGKYRRQVRYVPPIYMDMYTNGERSSWYKGPTDGSRTETLRRDLRQAADVCGGYIWFWGEKHPWVNHGSKWRKPDGRIADATWADKLPGLFRAMAWAKDPIALYGREVAALEAKGALTNLYPAGNVVVRNDNEGVTTKPFRDYERYGVGNVFVTNSVPATGGAYYAISYDVKGIGPRLNVFFQDANGTNLAPTINFIYPDLRRGIIRAPSGSASATFVFGAKNAPGEETVYSNIKFCKLEDEE